MKLNVDYIMLEKLCNVVSAMSNLGDYLEKKKQTMEDHPVSTYAPKEHNEYIKQLDKLKNNIHLNEVYISYYFKQATEEIEK